jgi:hypothetical protein
MAAQGTGLTKLVSFYVGIAVGVQIALLVGVTAAGDLPSLQVADLVRRLFVVNLIVGAFALAILIVLVAKTRRRN